MVGIVGCPDRFQYRGLVEAICPPQLKSDEERGPFRGFCCHRKPFFIISKASSMALTMEFIKRFKDKKILRIPANKKRKLHQKGLPNYFHQGTTHIALT